MRLSNRRLSPDVSEPCGALVRTVWKAQLASVLLQQCLRGDDTSGVRFLRLFAAEKLLL